MARTLRACAAYGDDRFLGTKRAGEGFRWVTYKEFGETVKRCREALRDAGVQQGDRVAVMSNNRVEWAVTAYSVFGMGATLVPLYEAQKLKVGPEACAYDSHTHRQRQTRTHTQRLTQTHTDTRARHTHRQRPAHTQAERTHIRYTHTQLSAPAGRESSWLSAVLTP
jgi:non-ribosomal peptide synthetase component E (peptide arylation enzyme)